MRHCSAQKRTTENCWTGAYNPAAVGGGSLSITEVLVEKKGAMIFVESGCLSTLVTSELIYNWSQRSRIKALDEREMR